MYRHALAAAAFAGFAFCASCATVHDSPKQAGAMAALEEPEPTKTLTVGDPAPPLDIEHWVKGEPITGFDAGQVYVVEFWATWCGPCIRSMPHLSELQDRYADYGVHIVGVSDEPLETVTEFLKKERTDDETWEEAIRYTLTTDPDRSVFNDYMRAAGRGGIPCAFVVGKDGHIEWIGHPMVMDDVLHSIVHDEWDREEARQAAIREQEAQRKAMEQRRAMAQARAEGDWETVLAMLDEQIRASDNNPRIMYQRFVTLIADVKSFHAGYGYGERLVDRAWDDPMLLNMIAWFVVDDSRVEKRDLNFAMRAAERAVELTEEKDAAILDTLARVYYESGELDAAIRWQRQAAEHAPEGRMGDGVKETLEKYEAEAAAR